MMNKIILVDFSVFAFRALFSLMKQTNMSAPFLITSMLIGSLKYIDMDIDDIIILACDKGSSWRKQVDSNYKSNRKEERLKYQEDEWWKKQFSSVEWLKTILDIATPFNIIEIEHLEADDIIAYAVRFFKDKECTIISTDSDFLQLQAFPNVKQFSPVSKKYKIVKNPYKILSEKIDKEVTDNLTTAVTTEADYTKRKQIVSLLELPKNVEELIHNELIKVTPKNFDLSQLPFNSLRERFMDIYETHPLPRHRVSRKSKIRKQTVLLEG